MVTATRDVAVVVTPPGLSEVDDLRAVAAAWTEAGFLRRFLWWEGEDAGQHQGVWSDGSPRRPLLDLLAQQPYEVIRLVSLTPLAGPAPGTGTDVPGIFAGVEDAIARRLASGQRLAKVGVLVPATGTARVSGDVLSNRWDSTLVVVDEDSVDPAHASREVREAGHLAAHATLALAIAGGILSGMDGGPFDGDTEGAGHQEARIRLVRCHARAIRNHGLSDEIVRETLGRRHDVDWAAQLIGASPAEDGDYLAGRAAREFLDGPGARLRRTPFVPPKRPHIRMTPGMALRLLSLFIRGRIPELRRELRARAVDRFRDNVEQVVRRVTFGDDTDVVIRFDGRPLGESSGELEENGLLELAEALAEAVERPSAPPAFPEEWRALRQLAFGLVDAGPLPDGCTPPTAGVHRLVVPASAVSVEPAWLDDDPPEDGRAGDGAAAGPALARIGRRIQSDTDTARAEFLRALERLKLGLPGRQAQASADRRYWYWWLGLTVVIVVGLITVIPLHANQKLDLGGAVHWLLGSLLGFLAGSTIILFLYLRKEFQNAHKANLVWAEYERARGSAEHEAAELIRLTAAATHYRDWREILARTLHVAVRSAVSMPADEVDLAALRTPSAFGVAAAETDPRLITRLAAVAGRRFFRVGWISGLYAQVLAGSMGELRFRRGLPAEHPDPDPDTESAARRELAARLRDGLADDTVISEIGALVAEQIADLGPAELFSAVYPVAGEPGSPAEFLGALRDAGGERAARFNRRLWTAASGYPTVPTETRNWLPDRVPDSPAAGPAARLAMSASSGSPLITVLSARLDLTENLLWSDLALFSLDEAAPEPSEPSEPLGPADSPTGTADGAW